MRPIDAELASQTMHLRYTAGGEENVYICLPDVVYIEPVGFAPPNS